MSYHDVLCPGHQLETGCNRPKTIGAMVQCGTNAGPVYEIAAICGSTAWIREPVSYRNEALVPLSRLRVVGADAVDLMVGANDAGHEAVAEAA